MDMIEVRDRTTSGCSAASICPIIPPIDAPTTWAGAIPSSRRSTAESSAMSLSEYCSSGRCRVSICLMPGGWKSKWVERPMSRLSKRTT